MATAPPRTTAYLLRSRIIVSLTHVDLELTDTNLRCTTTEYSKWIEERLGLTDLRARLSSGEPVVIFDFRRDQLTIKWLWQFYRAGFQVSQGDSPRWLVSLIYPTTGPFITVEPITNRGILRQWRTALSSGKA